MRFLFLNQFYPPDPAPTGHFLHDVASRLAARGHTVRVVCSRRAYGSGEDLGPSGILAGVEVERVGGPGVAGHSLAGRGLGHASFLTHALRRAVSLEMSPDLVVAATSPPFLGLAGALAARWRGAAHAEWTMDVYPDVILAHWKIDPSGWRGRALDAVARFQLRRATLVLTLGQFMSKRMGRLLSDNTRLETVPLWSGMDSEPEASAAAQSWRARRGWPAGDLVLLYSGNMGRGHRFGEFLEAARRLGGAGPRWAFVGSGPRRQEVERFREAHPDSRIELLPAVPAANVAASLLAADVHLVSLARSWQGLMVPSKLQAAFSLGRPVIFVGAEDNEVAAWIRDSGAGWVVAEDDVDGLISAVNEAREPSQRSSRGAAGRRYAREQFDRDRNCDHIADLLERAASRSQAQPGPVSG